MQVALLYFLLVPLLGYLASFLIPARREDLLSRTTFLTTALHLAGSIAYTVYWMARGCSPEEFQVLTLFRKADYAYNIILLFDKVTAVYLLTGSILSFLIAIYSRYYLHREKGYKRFFNNMLFFFIGYNIVVLSANLETIFIGWEILGISSFLLISFYRDRYLPVKNAFKVFSIYRIGDVGLILAMWMNHHLGLQQVSFSQLSNFEAIHHYLAHHSGTGVFISVMILVAAMVKSAQLPFTSWLPRAMEGPTPSSAIFYGSLSVHIGVFLLLRTFPYWEHQVSVRWLIALTGITTTVVATGIARVQSSIKSQIAYSSAAQIGLIFIEVAAGFHTLALIHFTGNAFLRTYQLLISPSIVTYLIRDQFYEYNPQQTSIEIYLPVKLRNTFYMLGVKEWNLDELLHNFLWKPLKNLGNVLGFLTVGKLLIVSVPVLAAGFLLNDPIRSWPTKHFLPEVAAFFALMLALKSFTERKDTHLGWVLIIINHCFIALAIALNSHYPADEIILYLSSTWVAGIAGFILLLNLQKKEGDIRLAGYHGHSYEHPRLALVFFVLCLMISGFPITGAFIGEDLLFSHINEHQYFLAGFIAITYITNSLSLIRIYSRVFLGPHNKTYHEVAYKSS